MQQKHVERVQVEFVRDWMKFKVGDIHEMYPGEANAIERFGHGRILSKRATSDGGQIDHAVVTDGRTAAAERGEKTPRNRKR